MQPVSREYASARSDVYVEPGLKTEHQQMYAHGQVMGWMARAVSLNSGGDLSLALRPAGENHHERVGTLDLRYW